MQRFVELARCDARADRLSALVTRIISDDGRHARLLNTLSRLEYIGVRKMLKSRRAERLDIDGLQHILDEAVHSLRLKKAALAVASGTDGRQPADRVRTFADGDTLAGDAAESYFQAVDRAAEQALADLPESARGEINYLLTSAAIEIRAQVFYPVYESALKAAGSSVSVASILRDEDRHLAEMAVALERHLADWRTRLAAVAEQEAALFDRFLHALSEAERPKRAGHDENVARGTASAS